MFDLSDLVNIYAAWVDTLQEFWTFFTTDLSVLISNYSSGGLLATSLASAFLSLTGFGSLSLLELMLTVGLTFYICYQFIIWVLNLIT